MLIFNIFFYSGIALLLSFTILLLQIETILTKTDKLFDYIILLYISIKIIKKFN